MNGIGEGRQRYVITMIDSCNSYAKTKVTLDYRILATKQITSRIYLCGIIIISSSSSNSSSTTK